MVNSTTALMIPQDSNATKLELTANAISSINQHHAYNVKRHIHQIQSINKIPSQAYHHETHGPWLRKQPQRVEQRQVPLHLLGY